MTASCLVVAASAVLLAACDPPAPTSREPDIGSSVAPLVLDPEQAVDQPVVGGTGLQSLEPQVARSGSQYLAVWRQYRLPGYDWNYRGARIASDGTVLDPAGMMICDGCYGVAIAPSEGRYLVASNAYDSIYLSRIARNGAASGIGIVDTAGGNRAPDVATDAGRALVVYRKNNESLFAAYYDGTVIHPPFSIGLSGFLTRPRVAAQPGGGYLVVWQDTSENVRGRFISADGVLGSLVTIASAPEDELDPEVAFVGSSFVAVWTHVGTEREIRAAAISPSGVVGPAVAVSAPASQADDPSISCSDTCTVLWQGGPDDRSLDLRGRRLAADLTPITDETVLVGGDATQGPGSSAGAAGEHYLVWVDELSGIAEINGATATDTASGFDVGPAALLATGSNQEHRPGVAASGTSWLVAWRDSRNGGGDLFGKRFTFDGVERTVTARTIHEGPAVQDYVALCWNGSRFLAAWADETPGALRVTRIEPNGVVLDPAGITIGTGNWIWLNGAVGGDGGDWLLAWSRNTGGARRLLTAVVAADGSGTPPAPVSDDTGDAALIRDAASGMYLLVWHERSTSQIVATRIDSGGAQLDVPPVVVAPAPASVELAAAAGGGIILLAWIESLENIYGHRLRVGASGIEVLEAEPIPFLVGPSSRRSLPSLTFAAKGFLLAFEWRYLDASLDVWGLQIAPSGVVQGSPFLLAGGPDDEVWPQLSAATGGRVLLAFERHPRLSPSRVVVRRIVAAYPDGATCSDGAQCESGFCADGRCCDSACGDGADDCQACSVKAGAAVDGECGPVEAGTVCRSSADTFCDLAEKCDGVSLDCPADRGRRAGEVCDAACGAICPLADESGSPHVCPGCP